MFGPDYRYEAEQLSEARRALIAPRPDGDRGNFAAAFAFCSAAFERLDLATILDHAVRSWVGIIDAAIDTKGLQGLSQESLWKAKAAKMSVEEAAQFSTAVSELAHWLESECVRRKWNAEGD